MGWRLGQTDGQDLRDRVLAAAGAPHAVAARFSVSPSYVVKGAGAAASRGDIRALLQHRPWGHSPHVDPLALHQIKQQVEQAVEAVKVELGSSMVGRLSRSARLHPTALGSQMTQRCLRAGGVKPFTEHIRLEASYGVFSARHSFQSISDVSSVDRWLPTIRRSVNNTRFRADDRADGTISPSN